MSKSPFGLIMKAIGHALSSKGKYDESQSYNMKKNKTPDDEKKGEGKKYQAIGDATRGAGEIVELFSKLFK